MPHVFLSKTLRIQIFVERKAGETVAADLFEGPCELSIHRIVDLKMAHNVYISLLSFPLPF